MHILTINDQSEVQKKALKALDTLLEEYNKKHPMPFRYDVEHAMKVVKAKYPPEDLVKNLNGKEISDHSPTLLTLAKAFGVFCSELDYCKEPCPEWWGIKWDREFKYIYGQNAFDSATLQFLRLYGITDDTQELAKVRYFFNTAHYFNPIRDARISVLMLKILEDKNCIFPLQTLGCVIGELPFNISPENFQEATPLLSIGNEGFSLSKEVIENKVLAIEASPSNVGEDNNIPTSSVKDKEEEISSTAQVTTVKDNEETATITIVKDPLSFYISINPSNKPQNVLYAVKLAALAIALFANTTNNIVPTPPPVKHTITMGLLACAVYVYQQNSQYKEKHIKLLKANTVDQYPTFYLGSYEEADKRPHNTITIIKNNQGIENIYVDIQDNLQATSLPAVLSTVSSVINAVLSQRGVKELSPYNNQPLKYRGGNKLDFLIEVYSHPRHYTNQPNSPLSIQPLSNNKIPETTNNPTLTFKERRELFTKGVQTTLRYMLKRDHKITIIKTSEGYNITIEDDCLNLKNEVRRAIHSALMQDEVKKLNSDVKEPLSYTITLGKQNFEVDIYSDIAHCNTYKNSNLEPPANNQPLIKYNLKKKKTITLRLDEYYISRYVGLGAELTEKVENIIALLNLTSPQLDRVFSDPSMKKAFVEYSKSYLKNWYDNMQAYPEVFVEELRNDYIRYSEACHPVFVRSKFGDSFSIPIGLVGPLLYKFESLAPPTCTVNTITVENAEKEKNNEVNTI